MHAPLATLTLRPEPSKPNFQIRNLMQRLLIQLSHSRPTILTHRTRRLLFSNKRLLAPHARLRLLCELHQSAQ